MRPELCSKQTLIVSSHLPVKISKASTERRVNHVMTQLNCFVAGLSSEFGVEDFELFFDAMKGWDGAS